MSFADLALAAAKSEDPTEPGTAGSLAIKACRMRRVELAEKAKVTRMTIWRAEQGLAVSIKVARKLASALGCGVHAFKLQKPKRKT